MQERALDVFFAHVSIKAGGLGCFVGEIGKMPQCSMPTGREDCYGIVGHCGADGQTGQLACDCSPDRGGGAIVVKLFFFPSNPQPASAGEGGEEGAALAGPAEASRFFCE